MGIRRGRSSRRCLVFVKIYIACLLLFVMDKEVWSSSENHSCFFRGAQKKSISAVVAVVLMILIVVAAVAILWIGILPVVRESFVFGDLDGRVVFVIMDVFTYYAPSYNTTLVQVKREADDVMMDRISISFSV